MKRLFDLQRAGYFNWAKTLWQMVMAAISQNLLKTTNMITLIPQSPEIA
jgi:IS5 family transposase